MQVYWRGYLNLLRTYFFSSHYKNEVKPSESEEVESLQGLLDKLIVNGELEEGKYQVHLVKSPIVNAMALPGGHIVIFSGLLKKIQSKNELAMVLGHELGHFHNRDHLKGIGRGLVFLFLSSITLGVDNQVSRMLQSALISTEMQFSQKQEKEADSYALNLLVKVFGHAGGAVDFFKRLDEETRSGRVFNFFATHPYPLKRIDILKSLIKEQKFAIKKNIPLKEISPNHRNNSTHQD